MDKSIENGNMRYNKNAPRGAILYWNWRGTVDGVTKDYGHTGISAGNGKCVCSFQAGEHSMEHSVGTYVGWSIWEEHKGFTLESVTPAGPPPPTPTGLTISSVNEAAGTAVISWNPVTVSGASVTYKVEYARDGKTAVDADYKSPYTATSYTSTGLNFTSFSWYAFRVTAVANGVPSTPTGWNTWNRSQPTTTAPSAPTGLKITVNESAGTGVNRGIRSLSRGRR